MKKIFALILALVIIAPIHHPHTSTSAQELPFRGLLEYQNLVLAPGSNESEMRFSFHNTHSVAWIAHRMLGSQAYSVTRAESTASVARRGQYIHRVTLSGLLPSNTYEYLLMGPDGLQSSLYAFRTLDPSDFSFFIVGDIQIGAGGVAEDAVSWQNTMNIATSNFPDAGMILSAGDQVHQGGSIGAFDSLFRPFQNPRSRLPFAPTVGNHDSGTRFFLEHHNLPNVSTFGTGATQMNYWFRHGSALFVVLNSNTTDINAHRQFLENTVQSNQDAVWKVLMFHHGPYTEFRAAHYAPKVAIRNTWIPVIDALGFDIVLNGHCHAYNRTFHLIGGQPQMNQVQLSDNTVLDPTGTVYFTFNSSVGNRFYSLAGRNPRPFTAARNQAYLPNFSVANVSDTSFTITTFQVNPDGTILEIDSYMIIKSR